MDKKSKISFVIFFALMLVAIFFSYDRYILRGDITFFTEGFILEEGN